MAGPSSPLSCRFLFHIPQSSPQQGCMADPDVDHGFVYDDQGRTDILGSPFFDVHFGNDETTNEYIDQILYQLTLSIEEHILPGRCITKSGLLASTPNPITLSSITKALVEGRLGGAGLDVFENEPRVPEELFGLDNVVLLPHVGSATVETRKEMANLVLENSEAHVQKQPLLTPVV
ncbi:hypothetical protein M5K25_026130 [Dendrobium thyrsiflorum]|uniref:D-isomer specific 2-hydroxyacid dehydrogenase NAD-binding domain-containing protein n=1 Tax=Dendrobium thyrsiflorum TaxID=117978 RepID=A0ABD0TWF8_DENTH